MPKVLQHGKMIIKSEKDCLALTKPRETEMLVPNHFFNDELVICALAKSSVCSGDSGGIL